MAIELATAYVSLVPSARGIGAATTRELVRETGPAAATAGTAAGKTFSQRFAAGLSSAGKSIARAGDKLSLAVSAPLLLLGKKATDAASDLNEAVNATNVVFGDSASIVDKWAKTSAQSMGLSERAFREALTPMGSMLQNLGFSQADAATQSVALASRAADMASVFNTDVSQALDAINAGLRGESDPLERFGVGLNEAAVQAEALRLGLAKEGEELTANDKAQARLSLIMSQTNKIAGDFKNTSDGAANSQRIMAAEAENAAAAFGQKLLPIKQKLIKVASSLIDWFSGLSEGQQDLALKAGVVAVALGPVLSIFGRLTQGIVGLVKTGAQLARWGASAATAGAKAAQAFVSIGIEAVKATAKVVAQIALQVARWTVLGVQALIHAAKVAAAWLISMGPIGLVIAAVAGAAALIVKHWDTIQRFVTRAAKAVLDFLKRNWPTIVAIITGPVGLVVLLITRNWDRIKGIFRAGVSFITNLWRTAWRTVQTTLSTAASAIITAITNWKSRIIGIFSTALTWLVTAGQHIIKGLWNGALFVASQFFGYLGRIPGRIRDLFVNAGKWLLSAGKRILQGLWDGLKDKWKDVTDWIGGLGKKIIDLKGPPEKDLDLLRPAGRNIMGGFFEELKRGQGPIFRLMQKLGVFIAQFFAGKGVGGGALTGLEDRFEGIVRQILALGRGQIHLVSGFRSTASQARLYARWLAGVPGQARAAPPGRSKHERGLAVDWGGNRALYTRLSKMFGLVAPVRGEYWHWQPKWAGQTHSYFHRGGVLPEDVFGVGPSGNTYSFEARERIVPAGVGSNVYVSPGAVVIGIPPGATEDEARRRGRAGARGFLEVLAQRQIRTDARIA